MHEAIYTTLFLSRGVLDTTDMGITSRKRAAKLHVSKVGVIWFQQRPNYIETTGKAKKNHAEVIWCFQ